MMMPVFFALMLGQPLTLLQGPKGLVSGAPRIRCEIELTSWCIATFDGSINMRDAPEGRVWELRANEGMDEGPLIIREKKSCSDMAGGVVKFIGGSEIKSKTGRQYHSAAYAIGANGCELEFRWPIDEKNDAPYKQMMLYGILVGDEKDKQLYGVIK